MEEELHQCLKNAGVSDETVLILEKEEVNTYAR
jgi:hypothetical protein